jgi:hypothetical protein
MGVAVTPLQKVIQMLEDLKATSIKERNEEQVLFSKFNQWCADTKSERETSIRESKNAIENADLTMEECTITMKKMQVEIDHDNNQIGLWQEDKAASTHIRGAEKTDFVATNQDYIESIAALSQAIAVLSAKKYNKVKQAESALIQLTRSKLVEPRDVETLQAFLQSTVDPNIDVRGNLEHKGYAYEFQSQKIVDMLRGLQKKFTDERNELEKEELGRKHAYEQMMQVLDMEIKRSEEDIRRNTQTRNDKQKEHAEAQAKKTQEQQSVAEDSQFLEEATAHCKIRSAEFPKRQQLRVEEQEALDKAIDILKGGAVGAGAANLPQDHTALLQVSQTLTPLAARIVDILEDGADRFGSKRLNLLAQQVAASPFDKVRKLIENLIVKLRDEARAELERKGWCDAELAGNKETRDGKTDEINKLNADIDLIKATIQQSQEEMGKLQKDIAEINKNMAEATEIRTAEKAKNEKTIEEGQQAQAACEKALVVLKEFYEKAGAATDLTQAPAPTTAVDFAPTTWDSDFKGSQGGHEGGVVGMMEVIISDFARLVADTTADEKQAETDYKNMMQESRVNLATKEATVGQLEEKVSRLSADLEARKKDLQSASEQLAAAEKYYEQLKPECVDSGVSYEERVKMREEEIQSLKEAQSILEGATGGALSD